MRPYGAAGCVHSCTVRHTNHTSALGPGTRTRANHLVTATLPRYYLDSLGSIDIWYLVVSINWAAPGPRPLLLGIMYSRLFLSG